MQAVVCYDFEESGIEDVPRPEPTDDEALIAVHRVQLSVTECALYRGEELRHHEAIAARFADGSARLFGHEFCGTVAETGADVTAFAVGDRVYAPGKIPCGACGYCTSGYPQYCPDTESLGHDRPGALAEYVTVPAVALQRLPDAVTDAEGAAMQPLASALLCVHDAGIETGDVVAVIGTGVMGYQAGQLARLAGAQRVYAVDVVPEKLDLAGDHGMIPIDAREVDPAAKVQDETDGVGADVVVEAVGGEQASGTEGEDPLATAVRTVRRGGTVLQIGHIHGEIELAPRVLRNKSVRWVNPTLGVVSTGPNTDTGVLAADLVATGRVSIEEYVTHELSGLEGFEEAVSLTVSNDRGLGPAQMIVSG